MMAKLCECGCFKIDHVSITNLIKGYCRRCTESKCKEYKWFKGARE